MPTTDPGDRGHGRLRATAMVRRQSNALLHDTRRRDFTRRVKHVTSRDRSLFELAPDAYLVLRGGRIVDANLAARALFGDVVGKALGDVFDDVSALLAELSSSRELVSTYELVRTRDGEARRFAASLARNVSEGDHGIILRDVTARRRREQLWESYQLLSESAHDIVLFIRPDGRVVEANAAAAHAYGYSREELRRLNITDLRAPATRHVVTAQMMEAFTNGTLFETLHMRRDGTTFPCEVSSRAATLGDELVLVSIIRDLSERKAMQARLLQADRMAAVGMLAAGVAHEINNPLAYALTNLEVLGRTLSRLRRALEDREAPRAALDDLELAQQMLAIAREGSDRVRTIVRDLKTFSRADDAQARPVDVRAVLDSCINMAAAELRNRARLVRAYGDVPAVEASESRLAQVFLNLLVNAAQALDPERGDANEIHVVTATTEDGRVAIEVHDNGQGIQPELRARIFEPFVTTKASGEGTGLGLFISREIVHGLGGQITVDSEPGRGTCMRVVLPATTKTISSSTPPRRVPATAVRRRRLLVIDDEDSIGLSLRRALEDEMSVVIATGGREALALLEDDRAFDAVLCDIVMPEFDGLAVYRELEARDPELARRFVFMSGGALTSDARSLVSQMHGRFIEKPFAVEELQALLHRRMGTMTK